MGVERSLGPPNASSGSFSLSDQNGPEDAWVVRRGGYVDARCRRRTRAGARAEAVCPKREHAGSRVRLAGLNGPPGHRRQRYACVPANGDRPHRFAEPLPREESWADACEACERGVARVRARTVDAFIVTLAAELAECGITVNALDPGPTDTGWMSDEQRAEITPSSSTTTPRRLPGSSSTPTTASVADTRRTIAIARRAQALGPAPPGRPGPRSPPSDHGCGHRSRSRHRRRQTYLSPRNRARRA